MDDPLKGGHPLGAKAPATWQPKHEQIYRLKYLARSGNDLEFHYTLDLVPSAALLDKSLIVHDPTEFLDIHIVEDCRIIIELGQNLTWCTKHDAIFTDRNMAGHYFELAYDVSGVWTPKEQVPQGYECKRIRFGAKKNDETVDDKNHKFSLNIDLHYGNGTSLLMTLDPDIRNPGGGGK